MLEIRRGRSVYCDGLTRRDFVRVGALGLGGLTLPTLLAGRAAGAAAPQAKAVLLLWMGGGPSHYETFDPKPDAPEAYRGPSSAIPTNVSGIRIHEWLPRMAKIADKYAIIRSIYHQEPGHTAADHWMQTGVAPGRPDSQGNPAQAAPYFGSVLARTLPPQSALPPLISIRSYGTYGIGGFNYVYYDNPERLGPAYAPLRMTGSDKQGYVLNDLPLPPNVTSGRLERRSRLARIIDGAAGLADRELAASTLDEYQRRAYGLVTSSATREAFDLSGEPEKLKEDYGKNGFGQAFLLGRRLVEKGVPVVSVSTGNWDTHGNLMAQGIEIGALARMRDHLCPTLDQAFSALLRDMDDRGLLKETLVLWMGEFGRSPKVEAPDSGRDHWPHAMSVVAAGGGVRGGQVIGSTTADGGYADERRLRPIDLIATIYQKMGVSPGTILHDPQGRPWEIAGEGEVIRELV
ncbi:MAG: DUF1501 domain-containing protein [Armatimonadota bacterium]